MRRGEQAASIRDPGTFKSVPQSAVVAFFAVILVGFWAITRVELLPDGNLQITEPQIISGDEPHHLLVMNSILFDHALELQDAYRRAEKDPEVAGMILPDHHTIVVNRRTGAHANWLPVELPSDLAAGPGVYEVSSHPIAYPALVAAILFPFRPTLENVQSDASLVMVFICWLGAVFTFLLARRVGMGRGWALLATALLALASPWLAYNRAYYSEPVIGLCVVMALYALEAERPLASAFGAAAAAIFKPPFAVVGGGFVIDRIQRKRWREVLLLVSVLGLCGLALMAFNYWLARTPIISGNGTGFWPLGSNTARNFNQLGETLVGSSHGLFIFAPWTIFAIFPIGLAFCSFGSSPRFLREMSLPIAMQLFILSASDFGPRACYGPRYWVPFLPWMAVAAAYTIRSAGWIWRVVFVLLAIASAAISIAGALRYPFMFSRSPWFLWHPDLLQR